MIKYKVTVERLVPGPDPNDRNYPSREDIYQQIVYMVDIAGLVAFLNKPVQLPGGDTAVDPNTPPYPVPTKAVPDPLPGK